MWLIIPNMGSDTETTVGSKNVDVWRIGGLRKEFDKSSKCTPLVSLILSYINIFYDEDAREGWREF